MTQKARTFRVFVSSTFSDLKAERSALQERVFPHLRELAMAHGCRFQAIDLRWGISEEAALDQQTMKICLGEIERCQKVSPRPNFIVLLGDRFGWRPLPYAIPAEEFEQLLPHLNEAERTLASWQEGKPANIQGWYRRDDNAVPPEYVLLPRQPGSYYADYASWESQVEWPLVSALERAAQLAGLSHEAMDKYTLSATGQEIVKGALQTLEAREHVFCFFRQIDGLPQDDIGRDFYDLNPNAASKQAQLKERIKQQLPSNVHEYDTSWQGQGPSLNHLDTLCDDVYADLSRVMLAEIAQLESVDALAKENTAHLEFGKDRARNFFGRSEALQSIANSLAASETQPLVIWGVSGSGKSALMARASQEIRQEHPQAAILTRFIGATPSSSNGRALLEDLCRQITHTYQGDDNAIPTEYRELVQAFPQCLAQANSSKPLIIFLDALDQLSAQDRAGELAWLPSQLPAHVHLIVSILPGLALEHLKNHLPSELLVELKGMSPAEGAKVLDVLLSEASRCLTEAQRQDILTKFTQGGGLPLYLKLAFEEARRWRSFDNVPLLSDRLPGLSPDIPGILKDLFWRLEQDSSHGQVLVAKAMGYLAAARNGLSEDEMLDVLWADPDVQADFFRRSPKSPQEIQALPVVIWSRLYLDLEPYLAWRQADGTELLGIYHRQVDEAIQAAYLSKMSHAGLSAYFISQPVYLGEGDVTPNLRKLSEMVFQQAKAGQATLVEQNLLDYVYIKAKIGGQGVQELISDYDLVSEVGVNRQKQQTLSLIQRTIRISSPILDKDQSQLPGHLTGRLLGIEDPNLSRLLEEIRYETHHPWIRPLQSCFELPEGALQLTLDHGSSISAIAITPDGKQVITGEDYDYNNLRVWDLTSGELIRVMEKSFNKIYSLMITPDSLRVVALQTVKVSVWDLESGECLNSFDDFFCAALAENGRKLVGGASNDLRVIDMTTFDTLLYLSGHKDTVLNIAVMPDGRRAISTSKDNTLKMWDLITGELLYTFPGHKYWVVRVDISGDGRLAASASYDGDAKIWDIESGKCTHTLKGNGGRIFDVRFTPDGQSLVISEEARLIQVWNVETGICRFTIPEEYLQTLVGNKYLVSTPSGIESVHCINIWSIENGECIQTLYGHTGYIIRSVTSPDGKKLVTCDLDQTLKVWDLEQLETSQQLHQQGQHTLPISAIHLSMHGNLAMSAAKDGVLKVWNSENGDCILTLEGHSHSITAMAVTIDGQRALTASEDHTIRYWDLSKGICLHTWPWKNKPIDSMTFSLDGRRVIVDSPIFSILTIKNGRSKVIPTQTAVISYNGRIALTGMGSNFIQVWDTLRGRWFRPLWSRRDELRAAAVSPDGRWGAAWTEGTIFQKGRYLLVWDLQTGACRFKGSAFRPFTISADGSQFVNYIRSFDSNNSGSLYLYETQTGKLIWISPVVNEGVHAMTHDCQRLVSGFKNNLGVWEAGISKEMKELCTLQGIKPQSVAIDEQGLHIMVDTGFRCYFFRLENVDARLPVRTAWSHFSPFFFWKGNSLAFDCPYCVNWFEIPHSNLGKIIICPSCGISMKLNSYTVRGNWRRVARSWKGK